MGTVAYSGAWSHWLGGSNRSMSKRFYIIQWCDRQQGWLDIVGTHSTKEHECIRQMSNLTSAQPHKAMRVWCKPHGWGPQEIKLEQIALGMAETLEKDNWPKQFPADHKDLPELQQQILFAMWTEQDKPTFAEVVEGVKLQVFWIGLVLYGDEHTKELFL